MSLSSEHVWLTNGKKDKNLEHMRFVYLRGEEKSYCWVTPAIFGKKTRLEKVVYEWTGITSQQAEMINSTYRSNDDVYSRVDTLKSDYNFYAPVTPS